MPVQKRCDVTNLAITDFDAGEGPMIVETPAGVRIRIEALPKPDGERWMLRPTTVKRLIAENELRPEEPESVLELRRSRRG